MQNLHHPGLEQPTNSFPLHEGARKSGLFSSQLQSWKGFEGAGNNLAPLQILCVHPSFNLPLHSLCSLSPHEGENRTPVSREGRNRTREVR